MGKTVIWKITTLLLLILFFNHPVCSLAPEQNKPVSLHFQEAPVGLVLQALADYQQLNLVMDEKIDGHLTVKLDQVPWQQALQVVLRLKRLTMQLDGGILFISPQPLEEEKRQAQLAKVQQREAQAPLINRRFLLRHAELEQLATAFRTQLSPRGTLVIDEPGGALLIKDIETVMPMLEEMLKVLDLPQPQVQIAAHIVTINSDSLRKLGVKWGVANDGGKEISRRTGSFNVNLPVSEPTVQVGFHLARFNGRLLELELSALEQENEVEIVANPRLFTTDRHKASIKQGSEIPYEVSGGNGITSIEFKEAVLGMEVTPKVMGNGQIELSLLISQNMPGRTIKRGEGEALAIDKQEIQTKVRVADGETLVLGGIFQHNRKQGVDKVPGLGNIPLLGHLFRRESREHNRRELVIFITPTVIKPAS